MEKQDLRKLEIEDIVDLIYKPKKVAGEMLARMAWELGFISDERAFGLKDQVLRVTPIEQCGSKLYFATDKNHEHKFLYNARFCNWRFCPQCARRLALQRSFALKGIMTKLSEKGHRFLFVTLTIPNVDGKGLSEALTELSLGWERLSKRKKYKQWIVGGVRKTEVTYNKKRDDFHPHLHMLVCVKADYFKTVSVRKDGARVREYPNMIPFEEWQADWQRAVRNKRAEQIDVKAVSNTPKKLAKSIAELAKYSAKDSDMTVSKDVFKYFYLGLKGKRLFAPFGIMRKEWNLFKEDPKQFSDYYEQREAVDWYYKLVFGWDFEDQDYMEDFNKLTEDEKREVQAKWLKGSVELDEGSDS
ncbi:protein rep [Enterococcus faecium]|nr:protein rep [Enterococcus faecium]